MHATINHEMVDSRLVFACPVLALGVAFITMNWWIMARRHFNDEWLSLGPFVGGLLGAAGLLMLPYRQMQWLWWIPLIVDPGCLPLIGRTLYSSFRDKFSQK